MGAVGKMTLQDLFNMIEPIDDDWEVVVYTDVVSYQGDDLKDIVRFHFTRQPKYEKKSVYKNYSVVEAPPQLRLTVMAMRPGGTRLKVFA